MYCEGIEVFQRYGTIRNGQRFHEFANPNEHRHQDFWGTLGSRRISVAPGTDFQTVVVFRRDFKLYAATGVMVVIVLGDKVVDSQPLDNVQAFYIAAEQLAKTREYAFNHFTTWDNPNSAQPTGTVPFKVPKYVGKFGRLG